MNKKILIIDDSISTIGYIEKKIKDFKNDIQILKSCSYKETKQILANNEVFAIITELNFSDSENGEIISLINSFNKDKKVPIIVLTSIINKELEKILKNKSEIIEYINKNEINSIDFAINSIKNLFLNMEDTIICITKNENAFNFYIKILKNMNFNILIFSNIEESLIYIKENKENIKLVISDFSYENSSSFNVVYKLRKHYTKEELGIIIFSFINDEEYFHKFLKSGANDFIHLPIPLYEFLLKINNIFNFLRVFKMNKDFANKDFLTNLYNRRFFFENSEMLLSHSKRENTKLSYIIMDIDNFKQINDNYGHDVGDIVIKKSAEILKESLRGSDLLCRYGGEEFSIILENKEDKEIKSILNKIKNKINVTTIEINENILINFSFSMGFYIGDENNIEEGLKKADEALYYSKKTGKNKFTNYKEIRNV